MPSVGQAGEKTGPMVWRAASNIQIRHQPRSLKTNLTAEDRIFRQSRFTYLKKTAGSSSPIRSFIIH